MKYFSKNVKEDFIRSVVGPRKIFKVNLDKGGVYNGENRGDLPSIDKDQYENANVVSSRTTFTQNLHMPCIDIDTESYHIDSSTPGHHHLYFNVMVDEEKYFALLDAMVDCGIVDEKYVAASRQGGATFVRLPWITK